MVNNNYIIVAPDTPTHYLDEHNHRPDVLDIVILKNNNIQYQLCNYTDELSSDHSPVIITLRVDLHCAIPSPNPIINSKAELDQEVEKLTSTVQNDLSNNTSNLNNI
ncbi:hypothetical protein QTP88_006956 [Uroleucon formosanum]